jgi:hypothetical protein
MSTLSLTATPVNANPAALAALERIMLELDYSGRCRSDARKIVARTGCVADCVPGCIDLEHLAVCEAEYIDALPAIHASDPAWNDRGSWMTIEDLQDAAAGRFLAASIVPPEMDEELNALELAAFWPETAS